MPARGITQGSMLAACKLFGKKQLALKILFKNKRQFQQQKIYWILTKLANLIAFAVVFHEQFLLVFNYCRFLLCINESKIKNLSEKKKILRGWGLVPAVFHHICFLLVIEHRVGIVWFWSSSEKNLRLRQTLSSLSRKNGLDLGWGPFFCAATNSFCLQPDCWPFLRRVSLYSVIWDKFHWRYISLVVI